MTLLQEYPELKFHLSKAAGDADLQDWQNDPELVDRFLRGVHRDPALPHAARAEAYLTLLGPTPGSLLGLAYLIDEDLLDWELTQEFLQCFPVGPAATRSLNAKETLEVMESLMTGFSLPNEEMVEWICHLLILEVVSEEGRQAALRRALTAPWTRSGVCRALLSVASAFDRDLAPTVELARTWFLKRPLRWRSRQGSRAVQRTA